MGIDTPLHLPDQPDPAETDTTAWDGPDPTHRPEPGLGPHLLQQVTAVADALDQLPAALGHLGDDQLTELMGALLRVHTRTAQVGALVVADADTRGTISASDAASPVQWVTGCARTAGVSIEPGQASLLNTVAQACRDRRNHVIATAIRDGSCTLATARTALRQTSKVAEVLPTAPREDIHAWFLQLDPALGSRGVTELTRRIIATYDPDTLCGEDAHLERVESLTWRTLPTGMTRLTADLAPATAATLKHAITALAAPQPARKQTTKQTDHRTGHHHRTGHDHQHPTASPPTVSPAGPVAPAPG